ncbi:VapE domain-containing protein [Roseateles sp.]|jgi:predicted P-loop ATPase|uniref:VapE domain-containing protein n=1 Tax=Roseateles sp. TaxID=1971397 RepID=UPI0037C6E355
MTNSVSTHEEQATVATEAMEYFVPELLNRDLLTLLQSAGPVQAKRWLAEGTISPYGHARQFKPSIEAVDGIRGLSSLLRRLESLPTTCLIRGRFVGHELAKAVAEREGGPALNPGYVLRRGDCFTDQPLHWLMIDVDHYTPDNVDPVKEPEAAAHQFIERCLPAEFHGASFHWSLSGSAGHRSKAGLLKMHLHFWLKVPRTSAELHGWARAVPSSSFDASLYSPVQVHYTAHPVFDEGVADPVPVRSGFYQSAVGKDVVDLEIDEATLAKARERRATREPMADPTTKPGLIGAFCRAFKPDDLARLLPELFQPSRRERHFDWLGHDSKEGVFITDCGQRLVSVHGTAPTGQNRLCNIYDFVRLHLFEQLDQSALHGCRVSELPSVVAMSDWIEKNHPHVLKDVRVSRSTPEEDFGALDALAVQSVDRRVAQLGTPGRKLSAASASWLAEALRRPDLCGWSFGYDSFDADIKVVAPGGEPGQWRSLVDNDYTAIRVHLEERLGITASKELIRDTVSMVAGEPRYAFDSAQLWLNGLRWDGKSRVDGFFANYCKAQDTDFAKAVSRYLWTALAGRVLQPGIKADMVPVLVGAQGCRKSSTAEAIAFAPRFFGTIDLGNRDDDTARRMRGRLVLELSELRGLGGRDAESTKEFLSRTDDCWVPKYKERDVSNPRRVVFIGTSNRDDFLADATGNRRWLPIVVGQCEPEAVRRDCEQLWAEGAALFKMHGIEFRDAERLAAERHANFAAVDPWEDVVSEFLDSPDYDDYDDSNDFVEIDTVANSGPPPVRKPREQVTTAQLYLALGLSTERRTPQTARRIKDIVTRLGWTPVRIKSQRGYQRPRSELGSWQPAMIGLPRAAALAAVH